MILSKEEALIAFRRLLSAFYDATSGMRTEEEDKICADAEDALQMVKVCMSETP